MPTDTSERGLEDLIVAAMTGTGPHVPPVEGKVSGPTALYGGTGWLLGSAKDYDRDHAVDLVQLAAFFDATQPEAAPALGLAADGPTRRKFLARLQGEIAKRGVVDVLRRGVKHGPLALELFYGTPSVGNAKAAERFARNRFSVTRQLRYGRDASTLALDLALFVNGLPVVTFELKNSLTKQTVDDAVEQYRRDRDPRELLFQLGRCVAHFAVDDQEVRFCTHLKGKASWFLPFNQGWNGGAGNPPNPHGLKTDFLWKRVLTPAGLTDTLENYAQLVEDPGDESANRRRVQIFPRYHQLDVVRALLADARARGVGRRYLVQHSAGSGKSNSIAWLTHQLAGLAPEGTPLFDTVIVVTDRRLLDKQLRNTIRQFTQVSATVGAATEGSGQLRRFLEEGKRIVITTVQKFPFVVDEIGSEHRGRRFAIVIDEAHSSQGGRTAAAMAAALAAGGGADEDEPPEDRINRAMESRRLLPNASYFAFTATPKNKTLELFGEPYEEEGRTKFRPFHEYTMKQAIQEGFILDVLASYTPVASYYRLVKTVEGDPEFDAARAQKKLRRYVEGHETAVRHKAEIIVDHFHEQVIAPRKIDGRARAMVVTSGVERAIRYFHAIRAYLAERKSPYRAVVAFSGEHEYGGVAVTEASLNGFASNLIEERVREDPYRFLVCADKFQTGYDEPLLHTMYVDKPLADIRAVQTLSRLNRAYWPYKRDVFVLDFLNDAAVIEAAFARYYRTTRLSDATDANKLHDLQAALDRAEVYAPEDLDRLVTLYLGGADRDALDPILDRCVAAYLDRLDERGQVEFKGGAKAFARTYEFLASVLPYSNAEWEKRSTFYTLLVPKLPAPAEDDLSRGILQAVDMDSYRAEKQAVRRIVLPDQDVEIGPVPAGGGGPAPDLSVERLSDILRTFNDHFGNISWRDADRVRRLATEYIPRQVDADPAYRNARQHSDRANARVEHDRALGRAMTGVLKDETQFYKQYSDNPDFRRWLSETSFALTYQPSPTTSGASDRRSPAADVVRAQLGPAAKWERINDAVWQFFRSAGAGRRLGPSAVDAIAERLRVPVDDVMAVLGILTGPASRALRLTFYTADPVLGARDVPADEVAARARLWIESAGGAGSAPDLDVWERWAGEVLVGWEPTPDVQALLAAK